jgi:protein SCO1
MMGRYAVWTVVGIVFGVVLIAVLAANRPYTPRGSLIEPPIPAADFTLQDGQSDPFRLSDQRGKLVLIFFGYTACPDFCPAALGEMKQIHQRLGNDAENVRFVFITVDPDRDTPEVLGRYVSVFNPDFIGLTGNEAELETVWQDYWVYRTINEQSRSAVGYLVDHTTRTYLVDKDGNLRLTYAFGTDVDSYLADIRYWLKQ